jgi:predicted kinase
MQPPKQDQIRELRYNYFYFIYIIVFEGKFWLIVFRIKLPKKCQKQMHQEVLTKRRCLRFVF